ncbi:hypothetical protein, partial [Streptomyces rubrogriseus]
SCRATSWNSSSAPAAGWQWWRRARVLLEGPVEQVAAGTTLNERFVELMGADPVRPLVWLA